MTTVLLYSDNCHNHWTNDYSTVLSKMACMEDFHICGVQIMLRRKCKHIQESSMLTRLSWWQCWLSMYSRLLACHQHCGGNVGCQCTVSSWHVINIVVTMLAVDVQSTLVMSPTLW